MSTAGEFVSPGRLVQEAITLLVEQYAGKRTHDSGHKGTRPTWIYTFAKFGNAQVAIPLNKNRLSLYIRASSIGETAMRPILELANGEIVEDYSKTRNQPVSNVLNPANAPFLSPDTPGNKLLRVTLPSIEAFQMVMDVYFDIAKGSVVSTAPPERVHDTDVDAPGGATLDRTARAILAVLIAHLEVVHPGQPETYLGYKQVHDMLALPQRGPWGRSLRQHGLEAIAVWASGLDLPAITGIVVDRTTGHPGARYFDLHGRADRDDPWSAGEVARSKSFDWSPFIAMANDSLSSVDLQPPRRGDVVVSRIIRDTAIAVRVKELHNFSCQICGHVIELSDGGKYAEAHHVRPLGAPHNGPDVIANLVCVCPNHHAQLDFGAIRIDKGLLRSIPGHVVSDDFIAYHNTVVIPVSLATRQEL